jgi:MFS family permease
MALSIKGLEPFRSREFTCYFISRFLSALATRMIDVAVAWLVYDITGSPVALGLIGLAIFTPNILFLLVAGHVADHYDRRRVLILCYCVASAASFGLYLTVATNSVSPPIIYALIFLIGTARAFSSPASSAIVPSLVPKEHFANAIAVGASAYQVATIIGPAIGGISYMFGASFVFLTTTLVSLTCMVLIYLLKPRPPAAQKIAITWEYLTAGLKFIRFNKTLLGLISLDMFAVLLGGATALLPMFAKDIFHTGPEGLGLLRSAPSLGAVVTALLLARFPLNSGVGMRMFQAVALFGLATIGFGLSPSIHFALPCLVLLGAADMVSVYVRSTLVQLETPDDMRGRVSAVNSMFIGASNELGDFESGVLASLMGPVPAVLVGGVGAIGITLAWMRLFPALRNRDKLA